MASVRVVQPRPWFTCHPFATATWNPYADFSSLPARCGICGGYESEPPDFRVQLAAVTDPVARAVLDIHGYDWGWCSVCVDPSVDLNAEYPCPTVRAVAGALGITVPE